MSRSPTASDFAVDVEGLGRFMFARRSLRDTYRIRGIYAEMTLGNYDEEGNAVDLSALGYATIQVLLVKGPDYFSFDGLDPVLDDKVEDKIMRVFLALRAKESSFRERSASNGQAQGKGGSALVRDNVPAPVQPAADGSAVS